MKSGSIVGNLTALILVLSLVSLLPAADFDGNSRSEPAIWRRASALWSVWGFTKFYFGQSGDTIVPGDYNGDGKDDAAIFRPASGLWSVRDFTKTYFGSSTDVLVTGGGGQKMYDYVVKPGSAADLVSALQSTSYRSVYIPNGTYSVSETINVTYVRKITGEGYSTRIDFSINPYYLSLECANCTVENILVNGGGNTASFRGNVYVNAEYVTVRNCWSLYSQEDGFEYGASGHYASFINCVAQDATEAGFWGSTAAHNPSLTNCLAIGCATYGFMSCSNLSGCTVNGQNGTNSQGFRSCLNVSASHAYDCDYAGFVYCDRLSGCSADGNGHSDYGFLNCDYVAACYAEDCATLWAGCTNVAASND